jgi:hypothetical protein
MKTVDCLEFPATVFISCPRVLLARNETSRRLCIANWFCSLSKLCEIIKSIGKMRVHCLSLVTGTDGSLIYPADYATSDLGKIFCRKVGSSIIQVHSWVNNIVSGLYWILAFIPGQLVKDYHCIQATEDVLKLLHANPVSDQLFDGLVKRMEDALKRLLAFE